MGGGEGCMIPNIMHMLCAVIHLDLFKFASYGPVKSHVMYFITIYNIAQVVLRVQ